MLVNELTATTSGICNYVGEESQHSEIPATLRNEPEWQTLKKRLIGILNQSVICSHLVTPDIPDMIWRSAISGWSKLQRDV